ncbi:hypothetical protein C3K47_09640 [Solitalea longa]|uniref:Lipoprotein n=1 Tax=Solitalea longa TaxID=2079460 RepID=A0A2S5A226_9SPHI|nr:hypothetical protein [Solitalea longa]POY36626.1 hypothetical protein C3K47_09640 [Solitalea longa]
MNKNLQLLLFFGAFAFVFTGCIGSKLGSAKQNEDLSAKIKEKSDVIDYALLHQQTVPDLASRGGGASRGLPVAGMAGSVISLATNAVKQMIDNDKKKYTAEYGYALTDLYFYDQLSTTGPFDPIGMQFNSFKLVRTFENNGKQDTAMVAEFELDIENPYSIINNSVFRLRLKDLKINYAKAKVAANSDKLLNVDFEITFNTSYVNAEGQLFKNVELGKFYLFVRKAPLDITKDGYAEYYQRIKGQKLVGQSFIVPRSFGNHIVGNYTSEPSYSQGAYNISIKVKESSKNSFVNQLVIDNSGKLVDALGDQMKKTLK